MKKCSRCGEEKELSEFYKGKKYKDGYRNICKECCILKAKKYYKENSEHLKECVKEWKRKNKDKNLKYFTDRYNSDPVFNLKIKIRRRIYMSLKSQEATKGNRVIELLGCDFKSFKNYIVNKFTNGMTWEKLRKGKIHIDHIRPCASFDLSDPEEQRKCFHYSNLQPLWAKDNLSKGTKYYENSKI